MCNLKIKFLLSELFYLYLQGGLARGAERGMSVHGCWKHSLMPKEHRHVLESGQCSLKTKALRKRDYEGRIGCSRPLNTEPFGLMTMINMSRELGSITFLRSTANQPGKGSRLQNLTLCSGPKHQKMSVLVNWDSHTSFH